MEGRGEVMQTTYREAPLAEPLTTIPFAVFASPEDSAVVAFTRKIIAVGGPMKAIEGVAARYRAELEPVEWVFHPVNPEAEVVEYQHGTAVLLRFPSDRERPPLDGAALAVVNALQGTNGYEATLVPL